MRTLIPPVICLALLLSAAIFGFFYAWICSTMWGLDAADPRVAIAAMQAMNASVRNAVFAPAFFATPFALALCAGLIARQGQLGAAALFGAAGAVYLVGGLVLTVAVNVPMNEALALIEVPQDIAAAHAIWGEYSGPWQVWNITRTIASGLAFVLGLLGAMRYAAAPRAA